MSRFDTYFQMEEKDIVESTLLKATLYKAGRYRNKNLKGYEAFQRQKQAGIGDFNVTGKICKRNGTIYLFL